MKRTVVPAMILTIVGWVVVAIDGAETAGHGMPYLPREEYGMPFEVKGRIIAGAGQGSRDAFLGYAEHVDPLRSPQMYMDYHSLMHPSERLEKRLAIWNTLAPGVIIQLGLSMTVDGDPKKHFEHEVADGKMDEAIDYLIQVLKKSRRPILIRIGFEFNGRWNGYAAGPYRAAYRMIALRLRSELKEMAACVWNFSLDEKSHEEFMPYYPGDDVVDWWSVNIFGEDHFTHKALKPFLQAAHEHRRPVLLGECTPRKVSVQLGEESVRRWYRPFFSLMAENPGIKAFSYIYWDWSKTRWSQWGDARFGEEKVVSDFYNAQMMNQIFEARREGVIR